MGLAATQSGGGICGHGDQLAKPHSRSSLSVEMLEHQLGISPVRLEVDIECIAWQWDGAEHSVEADVCDHPGYERIWNAETPRLIDDRETDSRANKVARARHKTQYGIRSEANIGGIATFGEAS